MLTRQRALVVWLVCSAVICGAAGFVIGRRWPIETITQLFRADRARVLPVGWSTFARSDFARYEMARVLVGQRLYVFGGFYSPLTKATPRVESLDLNSGRWTRLADMPTAVTHSPAAVVNDTVWMAGGFEGNNPGRATSNVWRYAIASNTWSAGPPLPQAQAAGSLVLYNDTLHYFGGYHADRQTNAAEHWTLSPGASTWTDAPPLIHPRGHLSSTRIGDAIYAFGGAEGHDPIPIDINDLSRYDTRRRAWEALSPTPLPISHVEPSTTQYKRFVLLIGGRSLPQGRENLDDIQRYDPSTASWVQLGHTPMRMLGGLGFTVGDTLYVGLGAEEENNPVNRDIWRRSLRNSWWSGTMMPRALGEVAAGIINNAMYVVGEGTQATLRYDIARGKWQALYSNRRPALGDHHAAEVFDGKLVLLGGLGQRSEGVVQIFDPVDGRWTLGPQMPFAAGASSSALIRDKIYVAGGIMNDSTTSQAAVLDMRTHTWSAIAPMPRPRNHAASATDGEKLFVFGGRGPGSGARNEVANGFDDVQIYDPSTNRWQASGEGVTSPLPLPAGRGGTGKAVFLDGEFWIIGGETLTGVGATTTGTYARVDIYNPATNQWRVGPALPTARHGIFPLAFDGLIFVAGGGLAAGYGGSTTLEVIWPRPHTTPSR